MSQKVKGLAGEEKVKGEVYGDNKVKQVVDESSRPWLFNIRGLSHIPIEREKLAL